MNLAPYGCHNNRTIEMNNWLVTNLPMQIKFNNDGTQRHVSLDIANDGKKNYL